VKLNLFRNWSMPLRYDWSSNPKVEMVRSNLDKHLSATTKTGKRERNEPGVSLAWVMDVKSIVRTS
jgi:hypothetical protein